MFVKPCSPWGRSEALHPGGGGRNEGKSATWKGLCHEMYSAQLEGVTNLQTSPLNGGILKPQGPGKTQEVSTS